MFAVFFLVLTLVAMTSIAAGGRVADPRRHDRAGQGLSTLAVTHRADIALPLR